jgi:hypothetical protein
MKEAKGVINSSVLLFSAFCRLIFNDWNLSTICVTNFAYKSNCGQWLGISWSL